MRPDATAVPVAAAPFINSRRFMLFGSFNPFSRSILLPLKMIHKFVSFFKIHTMSLCEEEKYHAYPQIPRGAPA